MALTDDKRNVFSTIGSYTSFMQQKNPPNSTDIYSSINNKNDITGFLIDILKVVAGTDGLMVAIGQMFTKVIDESEIKIKTALIKQFTQSNSGQAFPTSFVSSGIDINTKTIDSKGKLKTDPNSSSGDLLYNKNTSNFDSSTHNAILNAGSTVTYNNINIKYNQANDSLNIKPSVNTNIGSFFSGFISSANIINKKEVMTNIMDAFYGTLSNENNKTQQQILDELKTKQILDQALIQNPSLNISPNDLNNLSQKSIDLMNGVVNYDLGCGLMAAQLPISSLSNLISAISGSTDPFKIAKALVNTVNDSTSNNADTTNENKNTINDNFLSKLIAILTNELLQCATTQPQIRMLLALSQSFSGGGQLSTTISNDLKNLEIFVRCMAKEIVAMIVEFLFDLVISYLISLLTPVIKKILKEKTKQYTAQLKSLVGANNIL